MDIAFAAPKMPTTGAIATGVMAGKKLSPTAASLDKATGGAVKRAIAASRFTGKKGEVLEILAPPKVKNSRVILVGL
ncbi:MAG TPA: M17 family peptidase N-terminal domain-containing protein, partial [Kiloniellaceae bacterium]|nr:M17 family peptidase N-terminal domain-containing protein [Kiloniellaceae bacterium]